MALVALRTKQRIFERPSVTQAVEHPVVVRSVSLYPLRERLANTVEIFNACTPRVAVLLLPTSPTAILRRVALAVIYAIKCFALRGMPHIGKKVLKAAMRIFPSVADSNSSAAVILVADVISLKAAPTHIYPDSVRLGLGKAVSSRTLAGHFTNQATAGFNFAGCEGVAARDSFIAANTDTVPTSWLMLGTGRQSDDAETTERSSRKVYEIGSLLVSGLSRAASAHSEILLQW